MCLPLQIASLCREGRGQWKDAAQNDIVYVFPRLSTFISSSSSSSSVLVYRVSTAFYRHGNNYEQARSREQAPSPAPQRKENATTVGKEVTLLHPLYCPPRGILTLPKSDVKDKVSKIGLYAT